MSARETSQWTRTRSVAVWLSNEDWGEPLDGGRKAVEIGRDRLRLLGRTKGIPPTKITHQQGGRNMHMWRTPE